MATERFDQPSLKISFHSRSLDSTGSIPSAAFSAAMTLPSAYSARPASRSRPPCARRTTSESVTSKPRRLSIFRAGESRHANAAEKTRSGRKNQRPLPVRAAGRQRARSASAATKTAIQTAKLTPQGAARSKPSARAPSGSAAATIPSANLVFSFIGHPFSAALAVPRSKSEPPRLRHKQLYIVK